MTLCKVVIRFLSSLRSDPEAGICPHQQTPESEPALLVSDGVLAVKATVSLTHRLHSHVPLGVPVQRLHHSVAAEDQMSRTLQLAVSR